MVVYTNCESAELFLNDKSLGEQKMTDAGQILWMVPYEKGALKVVAKNNGKSVVEKTQSSAAAASKIELTVDKTAIKANRTDVVQIEVSIVDDNGIILPDADNFVEFEVSGPAKLLGVENGDILDLAPHKVLNRKVFKGKCLLLIQTTDEVGIIEVTAKSKELKRSSIKIKSNN